MRVAIVNDSMMAVECLRRVIDSSEHEIAWVAYDGAEAVMRCNQDKPDLVLMDLIMPIMDGVEATKKIMSTSPCAIVVVTATVSGNASKVFSAMGAGALDAVNTPVLGMSGDENGKSELLEKISTVEKLITQKTKKDREGVGQTSIVSSGIGVENGLVVIGASSGGPNALAQVLSVLPEDFQCPVVIVQHVDEQFSNELALWLNNQCVLDVRLAEKGDVLEKGKVLIAGTNNHLILCDDLRLDYTPYPEELAYRPSVDVFFDSVAEHWQGDLVAVLLTGMGRDGAEGLLHLRNKGAHTIAQDEKSCAVYGMPKAAVKLGAAVDVMSIEVIGPSLVRMFEHAKTGRAL